ncbi:MAG: hypothetical protein AB7N69_05345 [Immundisolibacter sp.]|uniref:hypothetical protein n=1 Tax=Immundisolibacter sp. TaxID=1934948 RepID=UPI003D104E28
MGAYFTRQTQHHKWLLERRSEAFAKFLQLLDDAHRKATDFLFDRQLEEAERGLKVLDAYQPALNQARIARLYLPTSVRNEFYDLAKSYWALHTQPSLGDSRFLTMGKHSERIQEIFEQELSSHFWLRPVGRLWKRLTRRPNRRAEARR